MNEKKESTFGKPCPANEPQHVKISVIAYLHKRIFNLTSTKGLYSVEKNNLE